MRKLCLLIFTLLSFSAFAGDKRCRVDVVFPYGTEFINDSEVITTFDGPLESLSIKYIHEELNKALAPLDAEVSGQGESSDYKIVVGFTGMLNKDGSTITDSYLKVKNYERSIEARKDSKLLGMLKNREQKAKILFDLALEELVSILDKCSL